MRRTMQLTEGFDFDTIKILFKTVQQDGPSISIWKTMLVPDYAINAFKGGSERSELAIWTELRNLFHIYDSVIHYSLMKALDVGDDYNFEYFEPPLAISEDITIDQNNDATLVRPDPLIYGPGREKTPVIETRNMNTADLFGS